MRIADYNVTKCKRMQISRYLANQNGTFVKKPIELFTLAKL